MKFKEIIKQVKNGNSVRIEVQNVFTGNYDKKYQIQLKQNLGKKEIFTIKMFDPVTDRATKEHLFRLEFDEDQDSQHDFVFSLMKAFSMIGPYVKIKEKIILKYISKEQLSLSYMQPEMIRDRYDKKLKLKFKVFKTRVYKRKNEHNSGERPIKEALNEYLNLEFGKKNIYLKEEFSTIYSKVRADLVMFSKKRIDTFEIKSELDSFARLEQQINGYMEYSNSVNIVLHHKKLNLFLKKYTHLLKKCNLYIYDENGEIYKYNEENVQNEPTKSQVHLLWKKELSHYMYLLKGRSEIVNAEEMKKVIEYIYPKNLQNEMATMLLFNRFKNNSNGFLDIDSKTIKKQTKLKKELQKKFNLYLRK